MKIFELFSLVKFLLKLDNHQGPGVHVEQGQGVVHDDGV